MELLPLELRKTLPPLYSQERQSTHRVVSSGRNP